MKLRKSLLAASLLLTSCTVNYNTTQNELPRYDPFSTDAQVYDSSSPPLGPKIIWNSGKPYFSFSDNFALGMRAFGSTISDGMQEHPLIEEDQSTKYAMFSLPKELEEAFLGSSGNTLTQPIFIKSIDRDGNNSAIVKYNIKDHGPNPRDKIANSN